MSELSFILSNKLECGLGEEVTFFLYDENTGLSETFCAVITAGPVCVEGGWQYTFEADLSEVTITVNKCTITKVECKLPCSCELKDLIGELEDGNYVLQVAGETCEFVPVAADVDTFGTIVDNGDGTYTWTSNDGLTVITWDDNHLTCAEVIACLGPIGSSDGSLSVTGDHAAGWDLTIADASVATDDTIDGNGTALSPLSVPVSADLGNLIVAGSDGKHFLDCATVATCITIPTPDGDLVINGANVDHTDSAGNVQSVAIADFIDNDSSNILSVGPNGKILLDCAAVNGCVTIPTHDGNIAFDSATGILTHTDSDGGVQFVNLSTLQAADAGAFTLDLVSCELVHTSSNGTDQRVSIATLLDNCADGGLVFNSLTNTLTHTNSNGDTQDIDLSSLIQPDVVTNLVDNADGTITYTNELAIAQTIDVCGIIAGNCPADGGLSYNAATGDLTHTSSDGTTQTVNLPLENFLAAAVYDPATKVLTLTLTDSTTFPVNLTDLVSTDVGDLTFDAGTGILTHTNSQGASQNVNLGGLVAADDGAFSFDAGTCELVHVSSNGTEQRVDIGVILATCASGGLSWNAVTNELTHTNSDGTTNVANLSSLISNPDGDLTYDPGTQTLSHVSSDGTVQTADLSGLVSAPSTGLSFDSITNQLTHTGSDGSLQVVDLTPLANVAATDNGDFSFDAGTCELVHTSSSGTVVRVGLEAIFDTCADGGLTFNALTNELTHTNSDGDTQVINLSSLIQPDVVTTLVDNADGTITYTNETSTAQNIDICSIISTHCPPDGDLVYNGLTGELTHTNSDGTTQTVILPLENFLAAAVYDPVTSTLTLTLTDGTTFPVDLSALLSTDVGNLTFDTVTNALTHTNSQGASQLVDLSTLVSNPDGDLTYDPVTNIVSHTSSDGTVQTINLSGLVSTDSGDFSFDSDACELVHVNSDGTEQRVNVVTLLNTCADGNLTWNGTTNELTHTNSDGSTQTINLSALAAHNTVTEGVGIDIAVSANPDSSTNYEVSIDVCELTAIPDATVDAATTVEVAGCVDGVQGKFNLPPANTSVLTDNADGSFTHNDGDGTIVTVQTTTNVDNGDNTGTVTDPNNDTMIYIEKSDTVRKPAVCDDHIMAFNADGTPKNELIPVPGCVLAELGKVYIPFFFDAAPSQGDTYTFNVTINNPCIDCDFNGILIHNWQVWGGSGNQFNFDVQQDMTRDGSILTNESTAGDIGSHRVGASFGNNVTSGQDRVEHGTYIPFTIPAGTASTTFENTLTYNIIIGTPVIGIQNMQWAWFGVNSTS